MVSYNLPILIVTLGILQVCNGQDAMAVYQKFVKAVQDCVPKFNVPQDVALAMLKHLHVPTTKDEKCLAECALSKGEMIVDVTVNKELATLLNEVKFTKPEEQKIANTNLLSCDDTVTEKKDKCEYVGQLLKCYFEKNDADNLSPVRLPGFTE